MEKKKQVLIVEPHETLRKGLRAIFAEEPDSAQVYEAAKSEDFQIQLKCHLWDLVVIHQSLVTDITALPPGNFVILAAEPDIDMLFAARIHGARAYLLENASGNLLRQTLHLTKGVFLTDEAVSAWLVEYLAHHTLLSIRDEVLTAREQEIFHLLWNGLSKREIAGQLGLSESTVKAHTSHIYDKLGMNCYQAKILSLLSSKKTRES